MVDFGAVASTPDYAFLLERLIDEPYADLISPVVNSISDDLTGRGVLKLRIDALLNEAETLQANGRKLTADNPVYRALVDDVRRQSQGYAAQLSGRSGVLTQQGVDAADLFVQMTTIGLDDVSVAQRFNVADPEAINRYLELVTGDDFRDELARYTDDVVNVVDAFENGTLRNLINGKGARAAAREIVRRVEGFPMSRANLFARTLYLESFREGTRQTQLANRDVLAYQVRIETLDARTCLACVALHGTRMEIGEAIDEHPHGRGVGVAVARGAEMPPQFRYVDDNMRVRADRGQEWWDALPDSQKEAIAGRANFRAMQAGAVQLSDFVGRGEIPVFGNIVFQRSLVDILGDRAVSFYS